MFAKEFKDLIIYNISVQLAKEIFDLTEKIPRNWQIKEADQIRRSSTSAPANISEGFARRFYAKDYIHYLNMALGSSDETQNHLKSLSYKKYINSMDSDDLSKRYKNLSVRIVNMINYLRKRDSSEDK